MKPTNRGATSLKRRQRTAQPMQDYDRLPAELRAWIAGAVLPWSPRSVRRAYDRALTRTRDPSLALRELDRLQQSNISKDAFKTWGADHPCAQSGRLGV